MSRVRLFSIVFLCLQLQRAKEREEEEKKLAELRAQEEARRKAEDVST